MDGSGDGFLQTLHTFTVGNEAGQGEGFTFYGAVTGDRYLATTFKCFEERTFSADSPVGFSVIEEIVNFLGNFPDFETEVIVASIRTPDHVMQSAFVGADIATVPNKVLTQMQMHPLTDKGIEAFLIDAKKFQAS